LPGEPFRPTDLLFPFGCGHEPAPLTRQINSRSFAQAQRLSLRGDLRNPHLSPQLVEEDVARPAQRGLEIDSTMALVHRAVKDPIVKKERSSAINPSVCIDHRFGKTGKRHHELEG